MQTRMPWIGLGLGFIALLILYLDRSIMAYAITPIEKTFGFTNAEFGLILSGFGLGFMLTVIMSGMLIDRYGARKIWALLAVGWSVVCMLTGFSVGFWSLFSFRVLLGATEAPGFPAFIKMIVDWFPAQQRGRALALGSMAVPISSVIGAPLISYLIVWLDWRVTFVVLGALGIIWAVVWYVCYRDHPGLKAQASIAVPSGKIKTSFKFILLHPTLLTNHFALFVFGYVQFFALTWLPGYLQQVYGMDLKHVGVFLIAPWVVAACFWLSGGVLSDWLWMKTNNLRMARSHMMWICQLLSVICFILVVIWHSKMAALTFISLGVGFNNFSAAPLAAINADLALDRVATSVGVMNFAFALAATLAPLLTGVLSTLTGNFNAAIILMVALTLISAISIFVFHHPERSGGYLG